MLDSLNSRRLIQTIERGLEMENLELEINPADAKAIKERIADSQVLLSHLYYCSYMSQ